jgi:ribonucleoside-diphosphate reductase beta chain
MPRTTLKTTREGLDHRMVPMRLWRKAKSLGTWDPAAIDVDQDHQDWASLDEEQQDLLLRLSAQFQGGEESVTYDLLPFLQVMADRGRIEDEMFLTAYLWEEAKHVEGFDRFLRTVMDTTGSLEHYYTDAYRTLFLEELPTSLDRLRQDPSPEALADAGVTYQMIVEGVLAETGYEAYASTLETNDLLPGMQTFVRNVQRDEARHVAYGVYLLSRLVAEHGAPVWSVIEDRMNILLPITLDHIQATLAPYGTAIPFGVTADDFLDYASRQFQKRLTRIERARSQTVEDVVYA